MHNDDVLITEHSTERFHLWRLILQPLSPLILTILLKTLGSITLSFASSIKFMTYPFWNSVDSNGGQIEQWKCLQFQLHANIGWKGIFIFMNFKCEFSVWLALRQSFQPKKNIIKCNSLRCYTAPIIHCIDANVCLFFNFVSHLFATVHIVCV